MTSMSPKSKSAILILGLAIPYVAFVVYFVVTAAPGSSRPFPSWFAWAALVYMLGSILFASILGPKLFRSAPSPVLTARGRAYLRIAKGWSLYLILIWSCLFLYGAYKTLKGDLLIDRAVPAGAILLAFIAIFVRSIRRIYAAENQVQPYPPPDLLPSVDRPNPTSVSGSISTHDRKLLFVLAVLAAILVLLSHL